MDFIYDLIANCSLSDLLYPRMPSEIQNEYQKLSNRFSELDQKLSTYSLDFQQLVMDILQIDRDIHTLECYQIFREGFQVGIQYQPKE